MEPSCEEVSEMASGRNSYGMAWLCLSSIKKGKVRGLPFTSLDLSGCNLPPQKIFFILEQLPKSVEALKLGPRAVKGEALTLLRRFLESVGGGEGGGGSGLEEGGKEGPSLKSLSFART
uniref:Uncharacterized protein n=1 Tax=Chromera velia CCMP2878 TaxID=1169474 RepID=A0A0G4G0Y3_9ALVE|eukprot:Cvel_519.t1-p1 / transcript=Cvel_519.t1 / gene=Cvel_519 / organism=Chromera_velia_CCMP2878 / gene_product=hypothetical protein / transcript_product=hypothetical protein / location=Cvel_scaffold16:90166-91360(+) / protein_length=118 / sequence_SO=supercontig / SO=protein_coding / is_pseudo=false